jgi:hypothetical protein
VTDANAFAAAVTAGNPNARDITVSSIAVVVPLLSRAVVGALFDALTGGSGIKALPAGPAPPKQLPAGPAAPKQLTAPQPNTTFVDPSGNALRGPPGATLTGSPDGRYLQVRDADGVPTGTRIDQGHKPAGHPDPRAQQAHGHVEGVTNDDGTPWLPVK